MLPKKRRVPRSEFTGILKNGGWYHAPHFTLRAVRSSLPAVARFSVSTSKKVAKLAVTRNLLKRRVSSAIATLTPRTHNGFSGIFFAKKGATELSFAELSKEVLFLFEKAKMLS